MKEIRKSTFREIRSSFGRFMAIFAIIAMGVGFFAGLKVTKTAMTATVRNYLNGHAFYDLRLISTLGFDYEDVAFLREAKDAEAVEGSLSFDVLYKLEDGSQGVIKAYSLTNMNTLKLVSGRMPQRGDECVVDSKFFGQSAIGGILYLSEDNEEEDLEHFSSSAYTIVGTVQSPLYLQFERGNTSLGTGRLDGFVYLTENGFHTDYFTDIYVRFDQNFDLYSQEYDDFISEKKTVWETLAQETAQRRFLDIRREAEEELADARKELAEKKAEGEAELADARQELDDAEREIADGEQAIADARVELADGERTLREKEAELADAKKLMAEKQTELAEARGTIAEKEAELADGERALAEGRTELESNEGTLEAAKQELAVNMEMLNASEKQLAMQAAGLQAAAAAGMITPEELAAGLATIAAGEQELATHRAQLEGAAAQLAEGETEITEAWKQIEEGERELAEGRRLLSDARRELADGEQAFADAQKELADGEIAIEEAKEEIASAKVTLTEKEGELADGRQKFADGQREYQDALKEFQDKIAEAEGELTEAEGELADLKEPETFVLGRDTNMGYVLFESDSDIVEGIANIFPLFFFLVAVLVCVTTMNRMVEEQRTKMGC